VEIKIDQIIRTRRKSIALIIQKDGKLLVRAPLHISQTRIQQFVSAKADWILSHQEKTRSQQTAIHEYRNGESFLYLGKRFNLEWVDNQKSPLILEGHFSMKKTCLPNAEQIFMQWYRQQARQVFTARVEFFAQRYDFTYRKIRLSSARTRWGSCSSKGTLSFTWRLVMAPQDIIDYVILHELVHLHIQNHSPAFWKEVQGYLPDYKKRRAWLKEHAHQLT
jgi:predicted metal-dependent hydrolase